MAINLLLMLFGNWERTTLPDLVFIRYLVNSWSAVVEIPFDTWVELLIKLQVGSHVDVGGGAEVNHQVVSVLVSICVVR